MECRSKNLLAGSGGLLMKHSKLISGQVRYDQKVQILRLILFCTVVKKRFPLNCKHFYSLSLPAAMLFTNTNTSR